MISKKYLDEISLWGTKQGREAAAERSKAKMLLKKDPKSSMGKRLLASAKKKARRSMYKKGFTVAAIGGYIDAATKNEAFNLMYDYTPRSFVSKDERIIDDDGDTLKIPNRKLNIDRLQRALVDIENKSKEPKDNILYKQDVDPYEDQVGRSNY